TSPGASNVFDAIITGTFATVSNFYGATLYARVTAVNNAGIESFPSANSAGTVLLDPVADSDSDGMSNASEDLAGTNPLDATSLLRILSLEHGRLLPWASVSNKTYPGFARVVIETNFVPISGVITATASTTSYLDTAATDIQKFYRVNVLP